MLKMLAAALMALATTVATTTESSHEVTVTGDRTTTTTTDGVASCDDINVHFRGERSFTAQEELPVGDVNALDLVAARNGGIRVDGWDQPRYAVTVCKAAAFADTLRDLHANLSGNKVTASGPEDSGDWTIFYLVHAPRNATLSLRADNGPLSLRNVGGTIDAVSTNGPLALKDVNGTVHATTTNGPISYSGSSGTVTLTATNGPLSVRLAGTQWNGTLEGRTENGPLSIKVPRDFASGILVTSEGRGPIACKATACGGRRHMMPDDEAAPRRLTLGSGAQTISLTTVNGPISVKEIDE